MVPPKPKRKRRNDDDITTDESLDVINLLKELNTKMDENLATTKVIKKELVEVKSILSTHDKRLTTAEKKIEKVESSVSSLQQDNESIKKDLNAINLIFAGFPDFPDEIESDLYNRVKIILSTLVDEEVPFDTAFRLGKYVQSKRRPVKVRFLSMSQRNLIYNNRSKVTPPFYINEDLPFSLRRDYSILHNKKKEEIQKGIPKEEIQIDHKLKRITIQGQVFTIMNSVLQPINSTNCTSNSQSSSGRNSPAHSSKHFLEQQMTFVSQTPRSQTL